MYRVLSRNDDSSAVLFHFNLTLQDAKKLAEKEARLRDQVGIYDDEDNLIAQWMYGEQTQ